MAPVTLHHVNPREAALEAAEGERKYWHYMNSYGKGGAAQKARGNITVKPDPKPTTLQEYERALEAHARTLSHLKSVARRLPRGRDRWLAVRAGIDAGFRKAEVARLFGVTAPRVAQMLAEDEVPF